MITLDNKGGHPAPDGDYLFVKENDQVSSPCGDRFDRQF